MENTFYIKKETSVLPKESGFYYTNKGFVKYLHSKKEWLIVGIEWWLQPISPKGMTLDEAKDEVAKQMSYESFSEMDKDYELSEKYDLLMSCFDEAAELFLQSNMAKMMEENEELKKSNPLGNYIEKTKRFYSINNGINIEQNQMLEVVISNKLSQLESEVLILKQAIEDMIIENNMSFVRTIGIGALQSITQ